MKGAACGVPLACSMRSLVAAMMTGDAEEFLLARSNGIVSFVGMTGICESHLAVQIPTKALAAYGVRENNEPLNIETTRGVIDATTIPRLPQRAGGETSYRSADISIAKVCINHEQNTY